uniref:Interleukin 22 receptor subunit alpha 1 n=1 Tax=Salvator merianae TaxID=96440 RepID=A0A8D0DQ44_SALMN
MKEFLIFLAWCSAVGCSLGERLPQIQNAIFLSTNFENVFTWELKEEAIPGMVYEVQYQKYGDAWHGKTECLNITRRFCNLTHETETSAERYHARVRAAIPECCFSEWVVSARFCPRENTQIGSPEVKSTPSIQSIKFFVQPPYTPLRDEEQQLLTVVDIFGQFGALPEYEVTIFNQKTQQQWVKIESNKEFEIPNLDPDTEYNGTIQIKLFDKISKPHVFRLRTLPDNTWLIYLLWVVIIMMTLIFGTLYCLIYKYVKQHSAQQPASLDFKDASRFQALTFSTEHILIPCNLSKPIQLVAEKQTAQICQQIVASQEPQRPLNRAETVYQQQAKMPSLQAIDQPVNQAADLPRQGYAPQVVTNHLPEVLDDRPITVQYGICFEGTKKATSVVNVQFKGQKPEQVKRLLENKTQWEQAGVQDNVKQTQPLLLQGDIQDGPQQFPTLLEEMVPVTAAESTGSYRKQPMKLSPSMLGVNQASILQGDLIPTTTPLCSPWSCHNFAQDDYRGQQSAWDAFAWTANQEGHLRLQATGYASQANHGLKSEPEPLQTAPDALDSVQSNGLFTDFFRDLELKLQWDHGSKENAVIS